MSATTSRAPGDRRCQRRESLLRYAGLRTPRSTALLQRGACTFELKAENAAAAGAVGIVIFNQGDTADPSRQGIPAVTLTASNTSGIPVLGTTHALGATDAGTPGL
jgi:hypothetical protein